MAMRMSGMVSGMDTDSIVQQLVEAKKTTVNKVKKKKINLTYKQDAWKDLNTKIKSLRAKYVSKLSWSSAYGQMKANVSDSKVASVITSEDTMAGTQELYVRKVAKSAYMTGAVVKSQSIDFDAATGTTVRNPIDASGSSVIGSLVGADGFTGGRINITAGDKSVDIDLDTGTTISDVVTKLKSAGVSANFDEKQGRFYVAAKNSGIDSDFNITALDDGGAVALKALGLATDSMNQAFVDRYDASTAAGQQARSEYLDADVARRVGELADQRKKLLDGIDQINSAIATNNQTKADIQDKLDNDTTLTADERQEYLDQITALDDSNTTNQASLDAARADIARIEDRVDFTDEANPVAKAGPLTDSNGDSVTSVREEAESALDAAIAFASTPLGDRGAHKTAAEDAEIELNGVTYTGSSNSFVINGMTITAQQVSADPVTITTERDVDGIYNTFKEFIKDYNALISEVDKLYSTKVNSNGTKASEKIEPLLDDEKDALSDKEIEKIEQKLKDGALYHDTELSSIKSMFTQAMNFSMEDPSGELTASGQVKKISLYTYGIDTLGYFEAAANEQYNLHIDGDPDDANTSTKADKLKSAISADPDTFVTFMSGLFRNLDDAMEKASARDKSGSLKTYGSYYSDKQLKSEYDDYTEKISTLEDKLNDYEDRWYKKFAKMETAMSKQQDNMSAISSLLGNSSS